MSKERELAFTIAEQWGNAACNKEQLIKDYGKEQAIAFATFLGRIQSGEINIRLPKPRMSWPELYQLFLEHQNKHQ